PALGEDAMSRLLPGASRQSRLALAAGLLQIHDFWEDSHEAAQQADDLGERSFSAYWHGIAHRREPDVGNAAYWFRRMGRHPVFHLLAGAWEPLVGEAGGEASRLIRQGAWDPFAFVGYCDTAKAGSAEEDLARRIQRTEMILLLDATARGTSPPPSPGASRGASSGRGS